MFRSRVAEAIVEKHLAVARRNIDRELAEWNLDAIDRKPWTAANLKFAELGEEMGLQDEPLETPNETLVAAPMPEPRVRKDAERLLGKTIVKPAPVEAVGLQQNFVRSAGTRRAARREAFPHLGLARKRSGRAGRP